MSDNTHIEWTDATWNPITGCSVVSAGCKHCYAMKLAGTRLQHHPSRAGLTQETKAGPVWTGEVRFNDGWLDQPLRWRRPRRIFVCAHSDLFHENVPDEWVDRVFAVMAQAPQHTFQVLTKRPERMRAYLCDRSRLDSIYDQWFGTSGKPREAEAWPLPNVWLGVSVEDQAAADERIPLLLQCPAAVRWISAEPLLGPLDLQYPASLFGEDGPRMCCDGRECGCMGLPIEPPLIYELNWVVAGGESGIGARPMHPAWARSLRDQCAAARVPFLFKQWGAWLGLDHRAPCIGIDTMTGSVLAEVAGRTYRDSDVVGWTMPGDHRMTAVSARVGKKIAGRLLDGVLHDGYPEAA